MRYLTTTLSLAVLLGGAVLLSGCSGEESAPQPAAETEAETEAATTAAEEELPAEVVEARAELAEADQQLVAAQEICPVSGKTLGSMGKPIKLTIEGREVFLCCDGCEEPLKSEPQKHLAKLDDEGS